eukprot:1836828-Prymnesium_polylepis.1
MLTADDVRPKSPGAVSVEYVLHSTVLTASRRAVTQIKCVGQRRRFVVGETSRQRRLVSDQHSQRCSREGAKTKRLFATTGTPMAQRSAPRQ